VNITLLRIAHRMRRQGYPYPMLRKWAASVRYLRARNIWIIHPVTTTTTRGKS
jgi:hypothetical protein